MSDLTFKSLKFRNFMSFGNVPVVIDLSKPGTCFITGENLDDGGSSGAGKTTLINALSYVLFDKVPSKVSKERLINRTNKDEKKTMMEVELNLLKGTEEYLIRRWRGADTGYRLVHVNFPGEPNKDITNAGGFNASIEELLGFSYELFKQIIFFDGNSQAFLDMPVGSQRELIEELLKITLLSRKAEALKKLNTTNEQNIKIQEALLAQRKAQVEREKQQVKDAEARVIKWEETHERNIEDAKLKLTKLRAVDFMTEESLHADLARVKDDIVPIKSELATLDNAKAAKEAELKRFPKKTELALAISELATLEKSASKITTELKHLRDSKCPYCLQKFEDAAAKISALEETELKLNLDNDAYVKTISELRSEEQAHTDTISKEIEELTKQRDNKNTELKALNDTASEIKSALIYQDLTAALAAKSSLELHEESLKRLEAETNPHVDALEALLNSSDTHVDTTELDSLMRLKEHYQLLNKLLTDKNSFIRKAIISKTLPFINKRIAFYTERLGLPHVVKFQPDMSCEITQLGRDLDHGNLSNGQKKRLNLSLCFAFRDTLSYLHSKVNVLFTDEIDGGSLDEQSVNLMIGLLKHKAWDDAIGIYVISHRPEFDGRCDRNVVVRLEGGFSTIIEQAED